MLKEKCFKMDSTFKTEKVGVALSTYALNNLVLSKAIYQKVVFSPPYVDKSQKVVLTKA